MGKKVAKKPAVKAKKAVSKKVVAKKVKVPARGASRKSKAVTKSARVSAESKIVTVKVELEVLEQIRDAGVELVNGLMHLGEELAYLTALVESKCDDENLDEEVSSEVESDEGETEDGKEGDADHETKDAKGEAVIEEAKTYY